MGVYTATYLLSSSRAGKRESGVLGSVRLGLNIGRVVQEYSHHHRVTWCRGRHGGEETALQLYNTLARRLRTREGGNERGREGGRERERDLRWLPE